MNFGSLEPLTIEVFIRPMVIFFYIENLQRTDNIIEFLFSEVDFGTRAIALHSA